VWNKYDKKQKGKKDKTGGQPESDPMFEEELDEPDDKRPKKKTKKHGKKKYTEINFDEDEEMDVKKEQREHRRKRKHDKEQTRPKHDDGELKKHRKRKKKRTKSHSDDQIVDSETELLSSAMLTEKTKKKRTHKEYKSHTKSEEPFSEDEQFLKGADSPLMSLTDISSEDNKSPRKSIFRGLFKW